MEGGFAYIALPALLTLMLILGSFKGEKNNGENLIFTLPVNRNDILNGRYLSMVVYSFLAMVICLIHSFLFSLLPGFHTAGSPGFYEILTGLVSGFFFSWLIPGQLKFGFKIIKGLLLGGVIVGLFFQAVLFSALKNQDPGFTPAIIVFIDSIIELNEKMRFVYFLITALILFLTSYLAGLSVVKKKTY
jgi:hypothetical protein